MGWWDYSSKGTWSTNDSYLRLRYPQHIAKAFGNVYYDDLLEIDDESDIMYPDIMLMAVEAFAERWGGLDECALSRALEHAPGRDRLAAMFELGHSEVPAAMDLLLPFLESADQLEHCAACVLLLLRHDERALSVVEEYLLTDAPLDPQDQQAEMLDSCMWYEVYWSAVADVLADWGPAWLTPVLRQAIVRLWERGEAQGEGFRFMYDAEDALCYALGRRGALDSLHGLALPPSRRRLALLFLALGFLQAADRFPTWKPSSDMDLKSELGWKVADVFREHFALSDKEARETIAYLCLDYRERDADPYTSDMF